MNSNIYVYSNTYRRIKLNRNMDIIVLKIITRVLYLHVYLINTLISLLWFFVFCVSYLLKWKHPNNDKISEINRKQLLQFKEFVINM